MQNIREEGFRVLNFGTRMIRKIVLCIILSTMGYWNRRLAKEASASESEQDLVFARPPSEQEAARKLLSEETAPVRIFISDSIRVEISDSCRPIMVS